MATVKQLHVNGARRDLDADAERTLLSVLRDDLDLTGCKYGCGEGRCGACTVLVDGKATRSCNTPVAKAQDKKILTIESLAKDDKLHPLQEAFLEAGALQCGYCTPGMILSALALLSKTPEPSRDDVISGLSGNVCRCGVYGRIVTAVLKAAKVMKEAKQ
jgi:aerobic-type carbon monoxide dehydrogenase small subunit (CoxS/CutS family)